jgi:hypothetical protein
MLEFAEIPSSKKAKIRHKVDRKLPLFQGNIGVDRSRNRVRAFERHLTS